MLYLTFLPKLEIAFRKCIILENTTFQFIPEPWGILYYVWYNSVSQSLRAEEKVATFSSLFCKNRDNFFAFYSQLLYEKVAPLYFVPWSKLAIIFSSKKWSAFLSFQIHFIQEAKSLRCFNVRLRHCLKSV